jgi:hypothetical protein
MTTEASSLFQQVTAYVLHQVASALTTLICLQFVEHSPRGSFFFCNGGRFSYYLQEFRGL